MLCLDNRPDIVQVATPTATGGKIVLVRDGHSDPVVVANKTSHPVHEITKHLGVSYPHTAMLDRTNSSNRSAHARRATSSDAVSSVTTKSFNAG